MFGVSQRGARGCLGVARTCAGLVTDCSGKRFRRIANPYDRHVAPCGNYLCPRGVFGTVIGIAMGLNDRLNRWFGAWLVVPLNIPALVVIVLCYLWIGLNETAVITADAFNKTAMVAVSIREGVLALDLKLVEMARVFRISHWEKLLHVVLPQLWPTLASRARNGLAIIWKIVLVVEILGRSDRVRFQIHLYF